MEKFYPAKHYVMVDDKLRILQAIKDVWKDRVTTVFPSRVTTRKRQEEQLRNIARLTSASERIADLLDHKRTAFPGRVRRRYPK